MITTEVLADIQAYMEHMYGPSIGVGRHRTVYRDGDTVLKVPMSESGWAANHLEQSTGNGNEYLANCDIDEALSERFGVPILRMEFVEHRGWSEEPDWTWSVDCGQVGYTKDGRLVAYDWDNY